MALTRSAATGLAVAFPPGACHWPSGLPKAASALKSAFKAGFRAGSEAVLDAIPGDQSPQIRGRTLDRRGAGWRHKGAETGPKWGPLGARFEPHLGPKAGPSGAPFGPPRSLTLAPRKMAGTLPDLTIGPRVLQGGLEVWPY